MEIEAEYNTVNISGLEIQFRKWKVKDKTLLDQIDLDTSLSPLEKSLKKRQAFVYNCLKNPVLLDIEQYNYVLSLIREFSLHNDLEFSLECEKCKHQFLRTFKTPEIVQFKDSDYKEVDIRGMKIKFGNIQDSNYDRDILNSISSSERYLLDLVYHIEELNGKKVSVEEALDLFQELDVDVFQELFDAFCDQRASCSFSKTVTCPECGQELHFEFDNISSFFPKSWNI